VIIYKLLLVYIRDAGEMETALQFYTLAKDYLSLVRVFCYCDNLDKVANSLTAYKGERLRERKGMQRVVPPVLAGGWAGVGRFMR
jgi:hypothetical protein